MFNVPCRAGVPGRSLLPTIYFHYLWAIQSILLKILNTSVSLCKLTCKLTLVITELCRATCMHRGVGNSGGDRCARVAWRFLFYRFLEMAGELGGRLIAALHRRNATLVPHNKSHLATNDVALRTLHYGMPLWPTRLRKTTACLTNHANAMLRYVSLQWRYAGDVIASYLHTWNNVAYCSALLDSLALHYTNSRMLTITTYRVSCHEITRVVSLVIRYLSLMLFDTRLSHVLLCLR